jgi:hypothetical protein
MKDIDMHPYDGIDYRYTSSDADKEKAISVIQNILGFAPETNGLDYSLNFYSGGIGVDDRLAIRCKFTSSDWPLIINKLNLKQLSEVLANPDWGEDFAWLVSGNESPSDIGADCCNFISTNKKMFQDSVTLENTFLFTDESNVNTWCVVWVVEDNLNYLSFDQG